LKETNIKKYVKKFSSADFTLPRIFTVAGAIFTALGLIGMFAITAKYGLAWSIPEKASTDGVLFGLTTWVAILTYILGRSMKKN